MKPKNITIDPAAIPDSAIDQLVVELARHLAEVEYEKQRHQPTEGRSLFLDRGSRSTARPLPGSTREGKAVPKAKP